MQSWLRGEAIASVGQLRHLQSPVSGQVLRFACVGVLGLAVNTIVLWLLTERAHLYYLVASALATEAAIVHNFTLNHRWTFADAPADEPALLKLAKFNLVALAGLALTVGALYVLTRFAGLHYLVANVVAVGSGTGWNYLANRRWTWHRSGRRVAEGRDAPPAGMSA